MPYWIPFKVQKNSLVWNNIHQDLFDYFSPQVKISYALLDLQFESENKVKGGLHVAHSMGSGLDVDHIYTAKCLPS